MRPAFCGKNCLNFPGSVLYCRKEKEGIGAGAARAKNMEHFLVSFNAIFPLTVCMALGYFLRRVKLLDEAGLKTMNKLSFK